MDESVESGARLDVSVSFGRFENDALCWEKWSWFSPNKYLEEVGNLSTPGSVAQKKAYFEAHYKKIAARKAEELEQEKSMNLATPSLVELRNEDRVENTSGIDTEFGLSNGERLVEEVAQEACSADLHNVTFAEAKDDNFESVEKNECAAIAVECGSSVVEEAEHELNVNIVKLAPESNIGLEVTLVGAETPRKDSEQVTPTTKERSLAGTKKKVVSPAAKSSPAYSTPRYAKPASISMPTSASPSLKKKVNPSSLPKSRNSQVGESKSAAPTSMHMPSLGPANSSHAPSMIRKSVIMEKMGDKEIVKRAFKTFLNHTNGSFSDEKSHTPKQVSVVSPLHHRKGKEGLGKIAAQRSQPGTRSKPGISGSYKSSVLDKKNATAASTSIGFRSDERVEKRKHVLSTPLLFSFRLSAYFNVVSYP
ncbi:UNVERIFIED_CONTAM: hypothetical protein Slati_1837600 [Sesamum latifolium]|uniref:TPX2 C-terminal domain-containing protein n=1 Tax=Sesamum latifolium TaxID=2727402 RepID=A0AAW2WZ68_9LAMI